jgi:hypothetical protein
MPSSLPMNSQTVIRLPVMQNRTTSDQPSWSARRLLPTKPPISIPKNATAPNLPQPRTSIVATIKPTAIVLPVPSSSSNPTKLTPAQVAKQKILSSQKQSVQIAHQTATATAAATTNKTVINSSSNNNAAISSDNPNQPGPNSKRRKIAQEQVVLPELNVSDNTVSSSTNLEAPENLVEHILPFNYTDEEYLDMVLSPNLQTTKVIDGLNHVVFYLKKDKN